ncbi:unnamed protein product [Didymodactylos carnosus]|uniref:Carbonic anhydrase n=1 Tax=Didymodactylos carnosus TaxID=1234261 RepID=A0A8S2QRW9_9BILA|nr:unnamed protein product [Didymodactylos carnosus]CAF4128745.1 unnamed protein product [Didymodactylos carnosus]
MSFTSQVPTFLKANEAYVAQFNKSHLALPPTRNVAIVACMDARIDPAKILGLEEGDAHVIRNAGGMVTFKDADLQDKLKKELHSTADHIAFLSIAKLEDSVRDDVDFLKSSPLLFKDVPVSGWLYDVKTGKLNRIV